jgi:BirA family transcriptional regulator, biotin operon repressor / biotin---[acetyl-CoA-carboxylase] ligase
MLTAQRVENALAPRPAQFYEQVESTNDLALEWLRQGAGSGAVVVADEQIKGRGRKGRTWYTPPGTALILSVILRPALEQLPQLTMLGALAISDMLVHLGIHDVGIKWPNDVQIGGRKVTGILPEAVWKGNKVEGAVLGMGVNVRIEFSGTELADKAISIEPALGRAVDRLDLLVYLLTRIDYWAAKLGTQALIGAWRERLTTLGQIITVNSADQVIHGLAESVDDEGALMVKGDDGSVHRVIAGDIALGDRSS